MRGLFLSISLAVSIPAAAWGGTLCGTITDQASNAPVAHAGIFLRTPAGAYTGLHGASDESGAFCVSSVPPGTYDLEVRVDDYQVAYRRGVVVTGTTDVEVTASSLRMRLAPPFPNPAHDRAQIRWTLGTPAHVELAIHDVSGRFVRGWEGRALPPGEHTVEWDLRSASGDPIAPGLYVIRLEAAGVRLVRLLVHAR